MKRRGALLLTAALLLALPAAAHADFGFVPGKASVTALNRDGTIATQAGAHPYSYSVHFELNTEEGGETEGGELRDLVINFPPGLVGNPQAIPSCPRESFEDGVPTCLPSTQVGVLRAIIPGFGEASGPLYNLTPPPGVAAQFGFSGGGGLVTLPLASVRTADYGISSFAADLPVGVSEATATIWGTPADPGHTPERGPDASGGIPSEAPLLPFLTLPTSCQAPPVLTLEADSRQDPGTYVKSEPVPTRDKGANPIAMTGCEAVPFSPKITSQPSATAADSPSGLGFELKLPNQGLLNPKDGAITETEPVKTEFILPAGITANSAAAAGLGACTLAQFNALACPEASKLGTLVAKTPLIEEAIEGSVYLAQPRNNPFGSFLAIYIIASAPGRGVTVKQAGEVRADPATGQLTTIVDALPPVAYSSFEVRLREGPRAPLTTPRTCGTYTSIAKLYPFSAPGTAVVRTAPFTIASGAGGAACASEAQLPNRPRLEAGTMVPLAGAHAPFLTRISRTDGEQLFRSLEATLPEGVSGKLAGIPSCSETQIAAAAARDFEGGGAAELASPSCPAASQVGTVSASAGAGPSPYYVQGKAYLAGPYKGAPLSLAIVTPAVAGPFDLGVVVVRAGLYVNESTGAITARSDPLPTILQGIPLNVRSAAVRIDREGFALNPTDCDPFATTGTLTSTIGALAPLSAPFQVGGCRNLGLKPRLKIELKGPTKRTSHPKLIATLHPRPGDANVSFAQVTLPKAAFLDQAHIKTICTRVQFAAGEGNGAQCPPGSIYGKAEAKTPLLDYPLKGTVYLRSSSNTLPDLVVAFKGPDYQPIRFALAGRTDAVKGALRNTFQSAPDVPVSSFRLELFGGKRGLVVLSSGLCAHPRAKARFKGHNGREYEAHPKVVAGCGGGKHRET